MTNISSNLDSRITRRAVLGGAAATVAVAARDLVGAQQRQTHMPPGLAPKPKGPLVFLDYDKEELDAAYDQARWAPNQQEIAKRNAQKNASALARIGQPRRLAYGPTAIEKLDLYATTQSNAPVHVFIHGGAWRGPVSPTDELGRMAPWAWMAEMFVDSGAHFISLFFTNVLATNGNLITMAEQIRRAVAWIYKNAASFGGDPNRMYVSGHSSGGHLAGVVLTTDWANEFGLPTDAIKGGVCASGIYELYPVSLSARNTYANFTAEVMQALSPLRHLDKLVAPLIVAYGTLETPEFQRQNREFAAAVKTAGKVVALLVGEGYNHFEVQETLGNPYGLLGRAVLQQMELRISHADMA